MIGTVPSHWTGQWAANLNGSDARSVMPALQDADNSTNIVVSSRAMDLLDCFEGDFGDVVFDLAGHFARQRSGEGSSLSPVEVTADDVRKAGEMLINALGRMLSEGALPQHVRDRVEQMRHCFQCQDH